MGFFDKLKNGLTKTRESIAKQVNNVFSVFVKVDDELFENLEEALIMADICVETSTYIIEKLPDSARETLLVLDATTGQNAVSQAKLFSEAADITGIILTKLDGTAKGGIVISIAKEQNVPVKFVGVGEGIDDLQEFNSDDFAKAIFEE